MNETGHSILKAVTQIQKAKYGRFSVICRCEFLIFRYIVSFEIFSKVRKLVVEHENGSFKEERQNTVIKMGRRGK